MIEEVKIDFRRQRIRFFDHGDSPNTPIYLKSRIMHPSSDGYAEQQKFDENLLALLGEKYIARKPSIHTLNRKLNSMGLSLNELI
jgi:hypothetical protein